MLLSLAVYRDDLGLALRSGHHRTARSCTRWGTTSPRGSAASTSARRLSSHSSAPGSRSRTSLSMSRPKPMSRSRARWSEQSAALAVYLWAQIGGQRPPARDRLCRAVPQSLQSAPDLAARRRPHARPSLGPQIWFVGVPHPDCGACCIGRARCCSIVAILAAPQLISAWRYDPHAPEHVAYYGVPLQTKLEYGGAYLALAALLAVMTYDVHDAGADDADGAVVKRAARSPTPAVIARP